MKKLIVVADWASDTLAVQEFKSVVEGYLKDSTFANIGIVSSTPSTIHTGFLIAQTVETEERYGRPQETIFFQNTDPRLRSPEGEEKPKGAEFIITRLLSGIFICGPNTEYNYSFIKNKIDELYHYVGLKDESQFRSRDLYSHICAHLMDELEDELELEEGPTDIIPELRGHYVVHIDNFGNIKTNITHEEFKGKYEYDDSISITINKVTKRVRFSNYLFGRTPGELVIYPGSSGQKDNPYLEISVWRHFTEPDITTGLHIFNNSRSGMPILIK